MRVIDLTQPFDLKMPCPKFFPKPDFSYFMDVSKTDPLNVTEFRLTTHVGTHVDTPRHLFPEGKTVNETPADAFVGYGFCAEINREAGEEIPAEDLIRYEEHIFENDFIFLNTGWSRHYWDQDTYSVHPHLSDDLADWLVKKKIRMLGLDTLTVDLPSPLREKGFTWPIHRKLLGNNVLVAENLTNLDAINNKRALFIAAPLVINGADGGPARILALAP